MVLSKSKTQVIYVPQPDSSSCQSACIAMVLRTTDVETIRAELVSQGQAGDPTIMGNYLTPRVQSYQFLEAGSLNDAKAALDDGCVVITHGWFTHAGHVVLLIGYETDPVSSSLRFIVHDPFAEYDFASGHYIDGSSGESARYSGKGIYATCVASYSYDQALEIYAEQQLNSAEQKAYLHIIRN